MSRPLKARLGLPGYASVLAEFAAQPSDILTMQKRTGIGKDTLYKLVTEMHLKGLLHVSGWAVRPKVPAIPVYAYGPGEDAAPPTVRANGRPIFARLLVRAKARPEVLALSYLMAALETPTAIYELKEETGIHRDTISGFLKAMRKHNLARIAKYQPRDCGGGEYVAMWQLGGGPDARYPAMKDANTRSSRRWRQRVAAAAPFEAIAAAFSAPANDVLAEAVA